MRNAVRSQHPTKDVTFSMACSNQPSIPSVPASTPYTGKHGFEISFQKQKKETKSATWTYSQELKKLYVRMRSPCPIRFRTCSTPPHGCLIRAMPLYIKPEHIQEVVKRCPNHASKLEDFTGDHLMASEHLLWCENKEAQYVEDVYTGRLSVVFPHEIPQAGTEWVTNLFQFACFSSCVGGLNRRPLQVVFTLEHGSEVLGRQAVEVRICACPGRDRRTEEKSELEEAKFADARKNSSLSRSNKCFPSGNKRMREEIPDDSTPSVERKRRMEERRQDEDNMYIIRVSGRQNFEMLKKIRDALELSDLIEPEQRSLVLQHSTEQHVAMANGVAASFLSNNNNHVHHHHGNYASAYVIDDMNKMASIDQTPTENEVTSTGINLQLVDIQQVLTPQTSSLSSLLPNNQSRMDAHAYLQPTGSNSADDDDEDGDDDNDDVVDNNRNNSTSSWLESINLGVYADQFRGYNLFSIGDLEKLTLEDLQAMSIPVQHKDIIWKKLSELKSKKFSGKHVLSNQKQILAPITEFQQRPPPLPHMNNNNSNSGSSGMVSFTDNNNKQLHHHPQQLIQLQQIIVNTHPLHNSSKIELFTPLYYNNSNELLNEQDHNYCAEA